MMARAALIRSAGSVALAFGGFLVAVGLGGCASGTKSVAPAPAPVPVVRKIALVPAADPLALTLNNRNLATSAVPIAGLALRSVNEKKAEALNERLPVSSLGLGRALTTPVAEALRAAGYEVEVLQDIYRPVDEPDDVDLDTLVTDAPVIVHLKFEEVGVYSGLFASAYVPRVNVQGKVYAKSLDDKLYDESLAFGADARRNAFSIAADPAYAYASFDELIARADELSTAFRAGSDALARRMAGQIIAALSTKTRKDP